MSNIPAGPLRKHAISRRPATPGDDRTRAGEPAQAWFFHPLRARGGCFVRADRDASWHHASAAAGCLHVEAL